MQVMVKDANKNKNNDRKTDISYFSIGRKKRNRYLKLIIPIIAGVAILIGLSFAFFPSSVNSFGPLGGEHEHAAFLVSLNGTIIDFSKPKYQVQSRYIHVENGDGSTLHRHASNVPISEFLNSVNMRISDDGCFQDDNRTSYCSGNSQSLRFYINGSETESINDYVINDGDRFLIYYGNNSSNQIAGLLDRLNNMQIQET
jgi:hypothetical protein